MKQTLSVEQAFNLLSRIETLHQENAKTLWQLIKELTLFKETKAYKAFNVSSWSEFIQSYTNYRVSYVEMLIRIGKKFGSVMKKANKLPPIGRLRDALPYVHSEEDAEEWYNKALTLPYTGWLNELRESKGKIPQDKCNHEYTEVWLRCKTCGKWLKRTEPDSIEDLSLDF